MPNKTLSDFAALHEPVSHGTALFPIALYEITSTLWMEERIWYHWHEELEILVVTRGCARMNIAGRSHDIREQDIVIVPSGALHSASRTPGQPFCFFALVFSPSLLDRSGSDDIYRKYIAPVFENRLQFPEHIVPHSAWQQELLTLLYSIRDLFAEKAPGFELLVKARLLEIWHALAARSIPASSPKPGEDRAAHHIKPVLAYLQKNYRRQISLREVAEAVHMSEGHLCRLFRSVTGMTLTDYLNLYRISVSADLLIQNRYSISEVAGMTGFNNISYFNKIFRRYMHMTPTQFRRSDHAHPLSCTGR